MFICTAQKTFSQPYNKVDMLLQLIAAYTARAYTQECLRQNNMQSHYTSLQSKKGDDPKAT
jgi:hypothetical protein